MKFFNYEKNKSKYLVLKDVFVWKWAMEHGLIDSPRRLF